MKRAFLLAHPARHSISPVMHSAAFKELGIDAHYQALDVPPAHLAGVVENLRMESVYGANVTIPHKVAVMPLLDALTNEAQTVGAVNTIINQDGKLIGHNTDATGFFRALTEDALCNPAEQRALVLGAGGAARAVVYALLLAGVERLDIYNRTQARAEAIAKRFATLGTVNVLDKAGLESSIFGCDVLVNTTSVGMEKEGVDADACPLPPGWLPQQGLVCDIVYRPAETALLRHAKHAGLKAQNGLAMLVYQGAEAFQHWTGADAPIELMFAAAKAELTRTST